MQAQEAMGPAEFRFTDPQDIELYGPGWYRYSEGDLIRTPARQLIEIEAELGMPLVDVMNGMRMSTILGDTAAAWLGVREANAALAGPFDEFNPLVMLITWRKAESGKAPDPTEPEVTEPATHGPPAVDSLGPDPRYPRPSGPEDTVILQTSDISAYRH